MWGFTVDDALISIRYARHLAQGLGYRFNPAGPSTDGVTPLPWPFVVALFAKAPPLVVLARLKIASVALHALAAAAIGMSVRDVPLRGWLTAALALSACLPHGSVGRERDGHAARDRALRIVCILHERHASRGARGSRGGDSPGAPAVGRDDGVRFRARAARLAARRNRERARGGRRPSPRARSRAVRSSDTSRRTRSKRSRAISLTGSRTWARRSIACGLPVRLARA